ncbi:hypothetical protein [Moheibacter sediminis]|uniref:Uncharacterized protein n=1 Tax=Moheibacter sediminis TaxID=1434700 RepID=A0A1W2C7H2_9FLAO|nr:hypothetical protein [Moheibacter sediminis]SMC81103.1 hypothetical protein SAMN06296427_10920 [Moheibacter sediminis]
MSCNLEPKTPVVKPSEFDQKAYAVQIKIERDSIKNLYKDSKSVKKSVSDSTKTIVQNQPKFKITTDTIQVKIQNGKAKIDTAKTAGQRFVFVLNSDTANKLSLKITPKDTVANLRINQIIDSKNNSDGPFGRELEYAIKEKGIHKIIISESQMAGKPWAGAFTFEVKLKW